MKSLFVVFLALAAIATAVEAKQTKKRGLEEAILGYAQQNQAFPLGGPLDLGSLQGLELKSFEALGNNLGSGLGGQGLVLTGGNLQGLSLGNVGQYGSGGAGLQQLNLLLGNGGLALQNNYASGYGVGAGSAPVSIPQVVPSAAAIPQVQIPAGRQFGARVTAPALPTSAPIPATAFPPTSGPQGIPAPVLPPAPLQLYTSAPAQVPVPTVVPVPEPVPVTAAPAAANIAPDAGRLGSGSLGYTNLGNGLFALGSGSLGYTSTSNPPQPSQVQQVQPNQGSVGLQNLGLYGAQQLGQGSGSLGYAAQLGQGSGSLGYAAQQLGQGSGSLGYAAQQLGQASDSLGYAAQQLGQGSGALGYASQQLGQGAQGSLGQGLQLNLLGYGGAGDVYGAQQVQQASGIKYTSTLLPGQGQGQDLQQLSQGYGGLAVGLSGLQGVSQVQGVGVDPGYGGYSLNNERASVGQAVLNSGLSGLNLGYGGGNIGSLGYGAGPILAKGY